MAASGSESRHSAPFAAIRVIARAAMLAVHRSVAERRAELPIARPAISHRGATSGGKVLLF
jgi:hypothetical protein